MWNYIEKLADAILNDIRGGLRGYHTNMSISKEQLIQDIIDERMLIIKEFVLKGITPIKDLMLSINCIPVDCEDLSRCHCNDLGCGQPTAHFEIPQLMLDFGTPIQYLGSVDRKHSFLVYTDSLDNVEIYRKYRKRGKNKPWVYIDTTPNSRGMLDGFIFGAPLIKQLSITAIFKDLRQLEQFQCDCSQDTESHYDDNFSFLNALIKERVTKKKILYYRSFAPLNTPNDQQYSAG